VKDLLGDGFYKKINFSTVLYFIDKLSLSKTVYKVFDEHMKNVLSKFPHEYLVPIGAFTQLRLESQNDKKCDTFEKLSQIISAIIRLIYPLSCEPTQPGI
jgi:hypothetical protein